MQATKRLVPGNDALKDAIVGVGLAADADDEQKDEATISDAVKEMYDKALEESNKRLAQGSGKALAAAGIRRFGYAPTNPEELKLTLLQMMIEMMTGKRAQFALFKPGTNGAFGASGAFGGVMANARIEEGIEIKQFNYESETVEYQAQGIVHTADGRTIDFDINLYMSREFASYTSAYLKTERPLCDPLVINYAGTAASLEGETFAFDLTMDGVPEMLATLSQGSGFLAYDRNGDGTINDGGELFGPRSGDGFSELREFDSDRNGWIDEADDIFGKLVVWSRDKDGNDQLFTLKDLGIGAIFLGDVSTQFSFKGDANDTRGVMRSSSFFLGENGGGGTISHVDMTI
jgi:hypothetical protein